MTIQNWARWGCVIGAATAFLLSGHAACAQSLYGAGGLFINPTADFPARGQISPAALALPEKFSAKPGRLTWTSYSLDYGLSDRLEVGATYLKVNPKSANFQTGSAGFYAKYRLMEARGSRPALAVGASFLGGGDANARTAFAVLRFNVTQPKSAHPVHLHLGALAIDQLEGINRNDIAPYVGADIGLSRNLTAFAEARASLKERNGNTNGTHPANAVGLAWKPVKNYKLVVVYGTNGWNDAPSQWGVGIGYSIGGGR